MFSHGIYSVVLLIFSNIFMTLAWYGHLKMSEEFSWFKALPLLGVIAFSWSIAFFEYCLQVPANRHADRLYDILNACLQTGAEVEPSGRLCLPHTGGVLRFQEVSGKDTYRVRTTA